MEEVSLHSRAWDALEEELEHDIEEYERYGRTGRADDLSFILNQLRDQRANGSDPEGADLGRYEEQMQASLTD